MENNFIAYDPTEHPHVASGKSAQKLYAYLIDWGLVRPNINHRRFRQYNDVGKKQSCKLSTLSSLHPEDKTRVDVFKAMPDDPRALSRFIQRDDEENQPYISKVDWPRFVKKFDEPMHAQDRYAIGYVLFSIWRPVWNELHESAQSHIIDDIINTITSSPDDISYRSLIESSRSGLYELNTRKTSVKHTSSARVKQQTRPTTPAFVQQNTTTSTTPTKPSRKRSSTTMSTTVKPVDTLKTMNTYSIPHDGTITGTIKADGAKSTANATDIHTKLDVERLKALNEHVQIATAYGPEKGAHYPKVSRKNGISRATTRKKNRKD